MKTLLYPKTYAKLIEVKKVNENELGGHPYYAYFYVYEVVDTGEIIKVRNPGSSGHTPKSAERETIEFTQRFPKGNGKYKKQKCVTWRVKMIGKIFKLYQRPQDNGRWMYRWLGQ